jgi:hypothetical protein
MKYSVIHTLTNGPNLPKWLVGNDVLKILNGEETIHDQELDSFGAALTPDI